MFHHLATFFLALLVVPSSLAESAPGFPIQVARHLTAYLDYSDHYVDADNDRHLSQADTLYSAQIYKPGNETGDETYMVIMVDADVTLPNSSRKIQLLQWLQPNLRGAPRRLRLDATAENATDNPGAFYYPPSPPGGGRRHYYTLLLYIQPEGWEVPEDYSGFSPPRNVTARALFDVVDFVAKGGLGEAVASTYFWFEAKNKTGL